MTTYDYLLISADTFFVIFILCRIRQMKKLSLESKRLFYGFLVWPIIIFLLRVGFPGWRCHPELFNISRLLAFITMGVDFLYYFGFKAFESQRRHQLVAGLLLVPILGFSLRDEFLQPHGPALVLPHYQRGQVWTDRLWSPKTYYFLKVGDSSGTGSAQYHDHNFGQAIFAPLTGRITAVAENGYVSMENEEVAVSVGPLLSESIRLAVGQKVHENQPLGLLATTDGDVPGVRLIIERGEDICFKEVMAGRKMARRYERIRLSRNLFVASVSETRFRVR